MQKGGWLLSILSVIIVILVCILIFVPAKKSTQPVVSGIEITYPKANGEVSSPLKITGVVNGDGWGGFEGQVGTALLLANNSIALSAGVLKATTDWTKNPVQFELTMTFNPNYKGPAVISFRNENPSGMPEKDKYFVLPVTIK